MKGISIFSNFPMWDSNAPKPSPSSSSSSNISQTLLLIIVILSVMFFFAGVLHLLERFLAKRRHSPSISESSQRAQEIPVFQRQLQQLFHLHDSGLDQAFIDALPVFTFKDIMGLKKEPFDCAVCLSEFSDRDDLRLLPLCGHAFHVDCIDTWLLSSSTCPLCRGALFAPDFCVENPIFREDDDGVSENLGASDDGISIVSEKRVFSVRLGRLRTGGGETGETSGCNVGARRCYSMGPCQYVVGDSDLRVEWWADRVESGGFGGRNGNFSHGKRIDNGSKGESFSVSKIWMWSKKDKFLTSHVNFP